MTLNNAFFYLLIVLALTAVWTFPAGLVANAARLKGRTWVSFYAVGLVSSWLMTSTVVAVLARTRHLSELQPCSNCRERIGVDASTCGYCGSPQTPRPSWQDEHILSRIKNQRIVAYLALGALIVLVTFLAILVNYPEAPLSEDFADTDAYLVALSLHLNLYTASWGALFFFSLTFAITAGAWVSREIGHPSTRSKVKGEPFFSTKSSDNA